MNDNLVNLKIKEIEYFLDQIAKLFVNPKITIVIRFDSNNLNTQELILTGDDLNFAIDSIKKFKQNETGFFMDYKDLVQLHKELDLFVMFVNRILPEYIDPNVMDSIPKLQELIEEMVSILKKR